MFPLESRLADAWPPPAWSDVTVLVAVSGGADSVALLRALAVLKTAGAGRLVAAHFNHRLRGGESDADQQFVEDLCRRIGVPCEAGEPAAAKPVRTEGDGLEAAARQARYAFLRQTAERLGARYVATAHTADDQAETILHRILRGTGLAGLAAMRRARPLGEAVTLIRPLLDFRRGELLDYLASAGQPFCEDDSNRDWAMTRNRIRHELLPQLAAAYNPAVVDALVRLGRLAGESQAVIDSLVAGLAERCVAREERALVEIDCTALAGVDAYLLRELLITLWRRRGWPQQSMGYWQWDELAAMADLGATSDDPRAKTLPGNIRAERHGTRLRISGDGAR